MITKKEQVLKFPLKTLTRHQTIHLMVIKHSHDQRQISCERSLFPKNCLEVPLAKVNGKKEEREPEPFAYLQSAIKV